MPGPAANQSVSPAPLSGDDASAGGNDASPAGAATLNPSLPDDRFIPIQAHDLIESLARDAANPDQIARLLGLIEDIIHQEATALERHVVRLYALVNPDRETVRRDSACAVDEAHRQVEACVFRLLEKANFQQLTEVQIAQAVRAANSHGLRIRVDAERIESLSIWIRGPDTGSLRRRTLKAPLRGITIEVPIYRRLVVVARLRGSQDVILKLFRDIPVADIEALLPHATVTMSWMDRAIIFGGGAGGFGPIVVKLATGAAIVGASRVLAIAAGVMMIRSFFGYRRTRFKRDSQRTRSLYFQNMANNAAVIHKFISLITEEEIKEAALACALLWDEGLAEGGMISTPAELKAAAEAAIERECGARCRFDVTDAIETLDRLSLWADRPRLRLLKPAVAERVLTEHRGSRRSWSYHLDGVAGMIAAPPAPPAPIEPVPTPAAAAAPAAPETGRVSP